jgi:hypothetical protein
MGADIRREFTPRVPICRGWAIEEFRSGNMNTQGGPRNVTPCRTVRRNASTCLDEMTFREPESPFKLDTSESLEFQSLEFQSLEFQWAVGLRFGAWFVAPP